MARAFLLVMDSVGIGGAPDAAAFGDDGADTLGHIAEARAEAGRPLNLPNLDALGLGRACELATGRVPPGLGAEPRGIWGCAREVSKGKDTPSGHWEIAGLPVPFQWGYFPERVPAFPPEVLKALHKAAGTEGSLANRHASGTEVIEDFGEEHIRTGWPIFYTSVDSVLQIAAHEERFGLERLLKLCETGRRILDPLMIGRVIARPFLGERRGEFKRTPNRRDYAIPPPEPTLLDRVQAAGGRTWTIGKIADIFAHHGVSEILKGKDDMELFDRLLEATDSAQPGDLVFANFVQFDSDFGHRRDPMGYAAQLESFDARLPEFLAKLRPGDLALVSADHGNDPTWHGTDHTREQVPILATGPGRMARSVGARASFADMGETLAAHLGLAPGRHGISFL
ncbi:phosphopentomutase [Neomegalonema sp.]|uniref:phosphopentomutase n=1 Tax=Neomegalonema sp. TaxID=2039713 RepID=UPI002635283B|nr:phosphopentomutase [Neomegalonema sp.]MDD2869911.1 phosphopentomutase [Neomegalonema sp.]